MDCAEKVRKRDALRMTSGQINDLIRRTLIRVGDIGKIFVMCPDGSTGQIMMPENFLAMEIKDIGGWVLIGLCHITPDD